MYSRDHWQETCHLHGQLSVISTSSGHGQAKQQALPQGFDPAQSAQARAIPV